MRHAPLVNAPAPTRLTFIDALRGIAAVAVMLYHFTGGPMHPMLVERLPWPVVGALGHGWLGVQVFFVLSGFVIAYAIGERAMTPRGVGRFALRRQLRLDPPYWASIAFAVGYAWHLRLRFGPTRAVPRPRDIVATALYVQHFVGATAVQEVYWTLAIEVQLYLGFTLLLCLLDGAMRARGEQPSRMLTAWVMATIGGWLLDLAMHWRLPVGWFVPHGYLFAMGACTWYALAGHLPRGVLLAGLVLTAASGWYFERIEAPTGAAVAGIIYLVGRREALGRTLDGFAWQWLGRLSYALYLTHIVSGAISRGALRQDVEDATPRGAAVIMLCGVSLSLTVALVLHVLVERPAIRLASKLRWDARPVRRDEGP